MSDTVIHFVTPPIPYFVDSGKKTYQPGNRHISRNPIHVFNMIVVTKGTLYITEDQVDWMIRECEGIVLRPDLPHYGTIPCREETEIMWIHFQTFGAWEERDHVRLCYENQSALFAKHKQQTYLNHNEPCSLMIPKKIKFTSTAMRELSDFFALDDNPLALRSWEKQASFQEFLQKIQYEPPSSVSTTAAHLAKKVKRFIHENYKNKITNSVLKEVFNYHPNYLAKCMLEAYGVTPINYLQQYRIKQAKRLLAQTNWSITQIAGEVGFSTPAYFSTVFTNMEGISPANYRKQLYQKMQIGIE